MLQNPIADENIKIPFTRFSDGLYRVLIAIKLAGRPTRLLPHAKMLLVPIKPGAGGTPHMKGVGMLVVSLRGVNFGFWSHLGCFGKNAIIFSREGLA